MNYADYTWFVVFYCGSVDCWPHAIFLDENQASKWGIETYGNAHLIKEMKLAELMELKDN